MKFRDLGCVSAPGPEPLCPHDVVPTHIPPVVFFRIARMIARHTFKCFSFVAIVPNQPSRSPDLVISWRLMENRSRLLYLGSTLPRDIGIGTRSIQSSLALSVRAWVTNCFQWPRGMNRFLGK